MIQFREMTPMEMAEIPRWTPPTYLKGCPKDRALVASDGERGEVLHSIGPAIDYWDEHYGNDLESWDGIAPGLWIIEARIESSGGGFFEDYDEELVLSEPRKMTPEEWTLYREEGCPWDTALWWEPRQIVSESEPVIPVAF